MSVIQWLSDVFSGFETEIIVFAIAISVHAMLFGGLGARAKPKKGPKASPKAKAPPPTQAGAARQAAAAAKDGAAAARAALQDLRAALGASDLPAALRHLRAAAPQWRSAGGATPSAAPDGLLLRLARLAAEQSMVALLLAELGGCGLLTARIVEAVLEEPAQRTSAAGVRQILHLARGQGVEPTGSMQCVLIRALGAERRAGEAVEVFNACTEKPACLRNTILDVCVGCHDMRSAEHILSSAQADGVADVITYNTILKAYLKSGDMRRARATMEAMRAAGLPPNVVTFNELIDASLRSGRDDELWMAIDEMEACGLQPNQVTCSILLKNIQSSSRAVDVERTMAMLHSMGDRMDEVLLSSACEACIRAGRADLLRELLGRQGGDGAMQVRGAHTFGSIIRARGYVGDLRGVRSTWDEMRSRGIRPTSITTGCMVEALVNNDGPEAGHRLIREMLGDEELRPLINSVIYNSVLKGLAQHRRFDRVWEVHAEMRQERVQLSIVTYNTLVDACAKSYGMSRIPALLEEMARSEIQANVVTYSTILKGYVQENSLDKAFELMDEMKLSKDIKPDEIAYNTLLDGCARQCLFERGMQVLSDMQDNGIQPSNFTLSVLVKLANRSHRLDEAFEFCDSLSRRHGLRLNVHVYNNLMQACTAHQEVGRALEVLGKAVSERVRPDARTYAILLRGCIGAGDAMAAAGLLAAAYGLRSPRPPSPLGAAGLQVRGGLPSDLLSEALGGIAAQRGCEEVVVQLVKDLRSAPGVKLDSKVVMRLTSRLAR